MIQPGSISKLKSFIMPFMKSVAIMSCMSCWAIQAMRVSTPVCSPSMIDNFNASYSIYRSHCYPFPYLLSRYRCDNLRLVFFLRFLLFFQRQFNGLSNFRIYFWVKSSILREVNSSSSITTKAQNSWSIMRSVMLPMPRGTSMKWLEISWSLSTTLTKAFSFGTFSVLAKLIMSIEMLALLKNLPKSSHWFRLGCWMANESKNPLFKFIPSFLKA